MLISQAYAGTCDYDYYKNLSNDTKRAITRKLALKLENGIYDIKSVEKICELTPLDVTFTQFFQSHEVPVSIH